MNFNLFNILNSFIKCLYQAKVVIIVLQFQSAVLTICFPFSTVPGRYCELCVYFFSYNKKKHQQLRNAISKRNAKKQ